MDADDPGFGVYVHWPFCASKCPYCDFNSHVRREIDQDTWRTALLQDLRHQAAVIDKQPVSSLFFGGGTPSLMPPKTVAAVIDEVSSLFGFVEDPEITLEGNPSSVEADKFAGFSAAGVNRVSLGVQALNDSDLRALGRLHTADEALRAFEVARDHFSRVSFDLIYGRQDQTIADWEAELSRALDFAIDHLSLYQLTIEPDTRFGDLQAKGALRGLPTQDLGADLYEATQTLCANAGFSAYEISNHAQEGAECRHNLVYWNYGPYLGIGPGAHGRVERSGQRAATVSYSSPEAWMTAVKDTGTGCSSFEPLSHGDLVNEYLMMGLRVRSGVSLDRFTAITGKHLDSSIINDLISQEFLHISNSHLSVTDKGRPVLNALLREILV